jgi:AcrR family transcriptional regulator
MVVAMAPKPDKRELRYRELLDVAREIVITSGLNGFSIERMAKSAGYSRPTVYAHFGSKEAVINSLAESNMEVASELMARAMEFEGSAREKAFALVLGYEVMARSHPEEFHMTELLGMPWVRTALPALIANAFRSMIEAYSDAMSSQVERAVAAGELVLPPGMTVGSVVFQSLSMAYGIYTSIIKERIILALAESSDPWADARAALQCYWDGIGWRRSGGDGDHMVVADRFFKESFPDLWLELEVEKLREQSGIGI